MLRGKWQKNCVSEFMFLNLCFTIYVVLRFGTQATEKRLVFLAEENTLWQHDGRQQLYQYGIREIHGYTAAAHGLSTKRHFPSSKKQIHRHAYGLRLF